MNLVNSKFHFSFTKTALLATVFLVTVSAERDCTKIIKRIKKLVSYYHYKKAGLGFTL